MAIVADIDIDAARSVAEEITRGGDVAKAIKLDVSNESEWQAAVSYELDHHKGLDVLVNNAGISDCRPVAVSSLDDWRRVMNVNLDGVFLGSRYAISAMPDGGSIVNIASVSGINPPGGGAAADCASKAAVRIFSKSLAIECADANNRIRVNVVSPGGVKTPIWEKQEFFSEDDRETWRTRGGVFCDGQRCTFASIPDVQRRREVGPLPRISRVVTSNRRRIRFGSRIQLVSRWSRFLPSPVPGIQNRIANQYPV